MKVRYIIYYLILIWTPMQAQEIISSSGNNYQNESGSITFTIGEPIIESFISEDLILTQGFHQTLLTITSVWDSPSFDLKLSVYPNPTNDYVIIEHDQLNLRYQLISETGEVILSNKALEQESKIDFQNLEPAVYFLKTYSNKKLVRTIKIIKN